MPVPSFALCLFLPVPRFPRADKVLPAQTFRFFFRSVNRVRFQRPLDVGDAVKAVPADLGELDAAAVPVALQGAGAYSAHLRRFPSGNPPVSTAGGLPASALADMLRYLFYPSRQFVEVGFFNHYHVHNRCCPNRLCRKVTGAERGGLMTHI